ncbi:MAG: metallophosphoesterase, partial [Candidatus Bilamarchaeaceae archaeon]
MKIAVIADTHLGYSRFYEDSFAQAKYAFEDASKKADVILFLGDLYDARVPSLQILGETISFLRELKIPVFAIHGNHERRSRGMLNSIELLEKAGLLARLHFSSATFEKNGEKIFIAGMGNIPDDLTQKGLERLRHSIQPPEGIFSILLLHQSFKEFVYGEQLSSIHDLEPLGYSLYLNGHTHLYREGMGGRFLIPGSTLLTQLTKEETRPKGYILYDTHSKTHQFIEIPARKFIFEEMEFSSSTPEEISARIAARHDELRGQFPEAVIKLKVKGTLKEGFRAGDISFPAGHFLFIDEALPAVFLPHGPVQGDLQALVPALGQRPPGIVRDGQRRRRGHGRPPTRPERAAP